MELTDARLLELAVRLGEELGARGERVTTAESCTGGWAAQVITAVGGSSAWFDRGFVTYSNEAKIEMLGVGAETLAAQGAVSEATVHAMAAGALAHSHAAWALAISGVAGPTGGTADKPVGTVCFAWAGTNGTLAVATRHFAGDRESIRRQSVEYALEGLLNAIEPSIA